MSGPTGVLGQDAGPNDVHPARGLVLLAHGLGFGDGAIVTSLNDYGCRSERR